MKKILKGACEKYWDCGDGGMTLGMMAGALSGLTVGEEYSVVEGAEWFLDNGAIKRTIAAFEWEEYHPAIFSGGVFIKNPTGYTLGKKYLINPVTRTVVDDDGDIRPIESWSWDYLYPPLKTRRVPSRPDDYVVEVKLPGVVHPIDITCETTQELPTMRLSNDSDERKNTPIFSGVLNYFPLAIAAVAQLSKKGNDKHNPGEPLHWAKGKSTDHKDCISRHLIDAGTIDPDSEMFHDVGLAWRALANLETLLEKQNDAD
tara:strand:- start:621 stop:1397 length:777 start_codon:yes stop_codon:yes gene_type:complete